MVIYKYAAIAPALAAAGLGEKGGE